MAFPCGFLQYGSWVLRRNIPRVETLIVGASQVLPGIMIANVPLPIAYHMAEHRVSTVGIL